MPINPIAASLLCYIEMKYSELVELNKSFPKFMWQPLTCTGYSTLHLLPKDVTDPFEEFNSWPKESRDLAYFQMTQRRKAAEVKVIQAGEMIEKGVISVIKFKSINEFVEKVEELSMTPDCCFTVLLVITEATAFTNNLKEFIEYQQSLKLKPSALLNCSSPDWTRLAVSFSKGSHGEFRIRSSSNSSYGGLFDLEGWKEFNGGITQLYTLKSELSYIIGITGKYGD